MKKNMFKQRPVDICNAKDMFNWLKEHPTYNHEIGFNVKIYNLELDGDTDLVYNYIFGGFDCVEVNEMLEDFEADHKGFETGFDGRSAGHLVLSNHQINNVLGFSDYEALKYWVKLYYGTMADYAKDYLRPLVIAIRDFDRLADNIRDFVNEVSLGCLEVSE